MDTTKCRGAGYCEACSRATGCCYQADRCGRTECPCPTAAEFPKPQPCPSAALTPAPDTATRGAEALTPAQIEQGWQASFSTNNPYCPCDLRSFTKAVRWTERQIAALPVQDTAPRGNGEAGGWCVTVVNGTPARPNGGWEIRSPGGIVSSADSDAIHSAVVCELLDSLAAAPPAAQASDEDDEPPVCHNCGKQNIVIGCLSCGCSAAATHRDIATPPHDTGTERGEAVAAVRTLCDLAQDVDHLSSAIAARMVASTGTLARYLTRPAMQASEGADSAVPPAVYYDVLTDNFYDATSDKGMGSSFYRRWRDRRDSFPTPEAFAARATQEPSR